MDHFGAELQIKSVSDQRIISGWAAYHSNVDRVADIIEPGASQKAVARLTDPSTVGVLIGHDMSRLPVGVPIKIEARAEGLYTEVKVFDGPTGDDLLGAARGLKAAGRSLGLSIGYRIRDARPDRVNGKAIRRLLDYDLIEFSYASQQAIANDKALVVGVKTGGAMRYGVRKSGDQWVVTKDGEPVGNPYDSEDAAKAAADKLSEDGGGKTHPNQLPDASFLYVAPGGQLDPEGKTVPRGYRHFPFRGADGTLDAEALAVALTEIPQAKVAGLSEKALSGLETRARAFLESAGGAERKTVDVGAPEWREGSPLSLRGLGYRVLDLSEKLATDHAAMLVLGDDTKTGERMRPEMRVRVRELAQQLADLVDRAEYVDRNVDGAADIEQRRRHLKLAEVGLW